MVIKVEVKVRCQYWEVFFVVMITSVGREFLNGNQQIAARPRRKEVGRYLVVVVAGAMAMVECIGMHDV